MGYRGLHNSDLCTKLDIESGDLGSRVQFQTCPRVTGFGALGVWV